MKLLQALTVALVLSVPSAAAADPQSFPAWDEPFPFLGMGNKPCSSWTEVRRYGGRNREAYDSWLSGFFSGYNAFYQGPKHLFDQYDEPHLADALDRYCSKYPDKIIAKVALRFLESMQRGIEMYGKK